VLDAVGNGVADIGHAASFYWRGKMPAAAFFTTVPFGLTPEHVAWVDAGGGRQVGRTLCTVRRKPHGRQHRRLHGRLVRREVKPRRPARPQATPGARPRRRSLRRLGDPATTPPAEILASLQSGVLDAAEFVGPGSDIALGLYRLAPFYYGPGFNKPNGTGECIVR
jgi:TRAP-type mannitol/chloroaromatic compound transport system substrate-binding protein